jgi:hypothetical protein
MSEKLVPGTLLRHRRGQLDEKLALFGQSLPGGYRYISVGDVFFVVSCDRHSMLLLTTDGFMGYAGWTWRHWEIIP